MKIYTVVVSAHLYTKAKQSKAISEIFSHFESKREQTTAAENKVVPLLSDLDCFAWLCFALLDCRSRP